MADDLSVTCTMPKAEQAALKRAIKAVGPAARKQVRADITVVAKLIQNAEKAASPVKSGNLQKNIRYTIQSLSATVKSTATRSSKKYKAYRYPGRLEFSYGGSHAYFYKTYDTVKAQALAQFSDVLKAAEDAYLK